MIIPVGSNTTHILHEDQLNSEIKIYEEHLKALEREIEMVASQICVYHESDSNSKNARN